MPKIVDKEAKRLEILEAALRVFAEKGAAKTKIIDIAKAAGIGKGTVYEYYPSKEVIFQTAMDQFIQSMGKSVESEIKAIADPRERLDKLIHFSIEEFVSYAEYIQVTLEFWAIGLRTEQIALWKEAYDYFQELIISIIDDGIKQGIFRKVDSRSLASALIGMMDGVMFQMNIYKDSYPVYKVADAIAEHFIKGLIA